MSLQHFYLENQIIANEVSEVFPLHLSPDDAYHAQVLRLAPKEHIAVIDAAHDYFECEIVACCDTTLSVRISQHLNRAKDKPSVILIQGIAKGDKTETIIRHATELGVSEFIPLMCKRCVVKLDAQKALSKMKRWQNIAKNAAMQSGQQMIPYVHEPATVDEVCEFLSHVTAVLICWEEASLDARIERALASVYARHTPISENDRIAVLVGPEGGFTSNETDAFLASNNASALVTLGSSVLRTETAGIVAPALVLHELERANRMFYGGISA